MKCAGGQRQRVVAADEGAAHTTRVIEMPHGVTRKGQCKRCRRMRRFRSAEPQKTLGNYLRRSKGSG